MRKHFLAERVLRSCSWLPREVVNAPGLSMFKRLLENAVDDLLYSLVIPQEVRLLD